MTTGSHDMEAVTQLLEERDRDLELAAKIGQSFLETNRQMQTRIDTLEHEARAANELVAQLSHEMRLKNDMMKEYFREEEAESEREQARRRSDSANQSLSSSANRKGGKPQLQSSDSVICSEQQTLDTSCAGIERVPIAGVATPVFQNDEPDLAEVSANASPVRMVVAMNRALDELQTRVSSLERENRDLRTHQTELRRDERELAVTEQSLITQIIRQLSDANAQIITLSEDVTRKTDLCVKQQEDYSGLLASKVDLDSRYRKSLADKEELEKRFRESQAVQHELTSELSDLRARVAELSAMLNDAKDEARNSRRRRVLQTQELDMSVSHYSLNEQSLASELGPLYQPFGVGVDQPIAMCRSGYDTDLRNQRCNTTGITSVSHVANPGCPTGSTSGNESMDEQLTVPSTATVYEHQHDASISEWNGRVSPSDSMFTLEGTTIGSPISMRSPRSKAIGDRATQRKLQRDLSAPTCARKLIKNAAAANESAKNADRPASSLPRQNAHAKLQIIKPLAGSQTLTWWQQLATPSLASVLQPKEGIQTRGHAQTADLIDDYKLMSDLDEEEENGYFGTHRIDWKSVSDTRCTYTYSTSRILHPTDMNVYYPSCVPKIADVNVNVNATLSTNTNTVSSASRSLVSTCHAHANALSSGVTRQPASTFSVSMGLAELLNERGAPQSAELLRLSDSSSDNDGMASMSQSMIQSQSQAVRMSTLTVPSVMTSSRSVTERLFAPPPPSQTPPSFTPTLESKALHDAALSLSKLDYFGIFNLVKTVTARVLATGSSDNECESHSSSTHPQQEALQPLWRPAPGSLSEKTLRYVSSSPNLLNLASHSKLTSVASLKVTTEPALENGTRRVSHLSPVRRSPNHSVASPRGLNLLAHADVDDLVSPKVVLRAALADDLSDASLGAVRIKAASVARTSLTSSSELSHS